jgi:molybdenum cofactor cytidylyltransferase
LARRSVPVPDIRGVLLAAGAGRRFGGSKLLHPVEGVPMAVRAARRLLGALPGSIAVVRFADEALARQLAAEGMRIVLNPHAGEGVGTSLACGVRATAEAAGWIIALADMPFIRAETIVQVARAVEGERSIAAPVLNGRRGHPVGFGRAYYAELTALAGDTGARALMARHRRHVTLVRVDDVGVHRDVDSVADLVRRSGDRTV